MGWDEQMINDLSELLDFLRDLREQSSVEAVAWAVGQWTAGGVQADVAVEAATDVAVRRLVSCVEQRPRDFQVRGRLCVGLAGFQRQLGEFHTRLVQRCLQEAWTGTPLPHSGAPVGSALHAGTAADFLREARDRVRGGPAEGRTTTTERTERPSASPEPAGDESGDDELTLMQLTMEEENELARLGLDDGLRSALRELLRGLRVQEDRGVGAEYRWGVNQVLDACEVARRACGVVERILRDRATSSQVMRCWPAQRMRSMDLGSHVAGDVVQWTLPRRYLVEAGPAHVLLRVGMQALRCPRTQVVGMLEALPWSLVVQRLCPLLLLGRLLALLVVTLRLVLVALPLRWLLVLVPGRGLLHLGCLQVSWAEVLLLEMVLLFLLGVLQVEALFFLLKVCLSPLGKFQFYLLLLFYQVEASLLRWSRVRKLLLPAYRLGCLRCLPACSLVWFL
ncbi:hypothetical protein AK812_SmicGene25579 [Symbiodinium microadriaticum]|uniref:Uncharacterized protein n=1 Tax=Symbiodinium microadriaticum TaxID=2951 RepID=A0A1Q9DBU3_SYMMI|nr:hypothetical protein AK812_SmicGene25579 [Symbiodinium microadriaticum]